MTPRRRTRTTYRPFLAGKHRNKMELIADYWHKHPRLTNRQVVEGLHTFGVTPHDVGNTRERILKHDAEWVQQHQHRSRVRTPKKSTAKPAASQPAKPLQSTQVSSQADVPVMSLELPNRSLTIRLSDYNHVCIGSLRISSRGITYQTIGLESPPKEITWAQLNVLHTLTTGATGR